MKQELDQRGLDNLPPRYYRRRRVAVVNDDQNAAVMSLNFRTFIGQIITV